MENRCPSCEVLMINGVRCHERGCPDAWKERTRECHECGTKFTPEYREQTFCSDECSNPEGYTCEELWNL
jgi:hypothetical protein